MLLFNTYSADHNDILHTSRQLHCSSELPLVGRAPLPVTYLSPINFIQDIALRIIYCPTADIACSYHDDVIKFSALLALCAGNSPVSGEFPAQRPVTRSFDIFFALWYIHGWVNTREAGNLRRYRAHYDVIVMSWMETLSACQWNLVPLTKGLQSEALIFSLSSVSVCCLSSDRIVHSLMPI